MFDLRVATDQATAVGRQNGANGSHGSNGANGGPPHIYDHTRVVTPTFGRRDYWLKRSLAFADVLGVVVALAVAALVADRAELGSHLLLGALTLPVWLVLFKAYGLYDGDLKRVSHTTVDDIPWLFHALLLGGLLLWAYYKVLPGEQLVLAEVVVFGVSALVAVTLLRSAARRLMPRLLGPERALILGDHHTTNLVSKLRAHPEYGLEPVGVVSQGDALRAIPVLPVARLDGGSNFDQLVEQHRPHRIILSHTDFDEPELIELLRKCRCLGLKVSVLPQLFDVMGPSVTVDDVEGVTVLGINPPVLPPSSRLLKRAVDVVVSASLLVLTAPLALLAAVAIKVDSRGPILFRQDRIGKHGRRFRVVKFRTMVSDAEARVGELSAYSADPNWLLLDGDPRVTRVGRWLRLSSIDELPQLWNVLKGQMSLVGPRPLPEHEDRRVNGWGRSRLDLTPGLTGLWQVLGRTDIPFSEMVKLDYLYVTNWSLWGDLRLIVKTFPVVLSRRGAN